MIDRREIINQNEMNLINTYICINYYIYIYIYIYNLVKYIYIYHIICTTNICNDITLRGVVCFLTGLSESYSNVSTVSDEVFLTIDC